MCKIVLAATMAKYKLEFNHRVPSIVIVTIAIEIALKPTQTEVASRSSEI